ncbi:MAG TPA: serine hydrolase [Caulobacteraceae bacterium]|jgi:D-alanyl-D-alanine carboxypeptidase (penicillin-binding protein 5/6)|nr:serine hydrolase [Caulobacteraceae bacterium]
MYQTARRLFMALSLVLATVFGADLGAVSSAQAQAPFFTSAPRYASIVMDAGNGEVLYQRNADSPRYPASISKIMTLYLTFEALASGRIRPNDIIVVSPHAASMAPSKLGLRPGETITVDDAMHAVAVHSANDMAVALAEKIGGSEARFATLMTLRAQELGMTGTHYVNASGLPDPRQISTARDIATLSRAVMRDYPQYYHYFSIRSFDYHGLVMNNHNGMLGRTPGVDGLKTGYIGASGFNLAASAVRDNRRLIVVVLGGSSSAARDAHVADLFDAGFSVLGHRAIGQNITVADNLKEPAPIGQVVRPPTEQGSGEQAGVQIVLTDATPAHHLVSRDVPEELGPPRVDRGGPPAQTPDRPMTRAERRQAAREAKLAKAEKPRAKAREQEDAAYAVQIGAYKHKGEAHDALASLQQRYSEKLGAADHDVQSAGHGYYRARFSGLSAAEAKRACNALHAHHQTCVVVTPEG